MQECGTARSGVSSLSPRTREWAYAFLRTALRAVKKKQAKSFIVCVCEYQNEQFVVLRRDVSRVTADGDLAPVSTAFVLYTTYTSGERMTTQRKKRILADFRNGIRFFKSPILASV
jgi:hypothetical protein